MSSSVNEFQAFMINDSQLKSTAQVNLFAINSDKYGGKPNRLALVLDGEHCLDRLYGGYFPDWSCGGQWNNMMAFLTTLFTNCHQANVHLAVFLNGSLEASRFKDWVKNQMAIKSNVNQVLKHLTKRMTPPPKVFWVPPCSLRLILRLAIRSLNATVINSVEDHHHEAMAFCWENGFHGVMSDDGEFIMFNPPKYFSAHEIKLSFQHDLNTTEFKIENMAKELDLNPSRFCLVGALLGNHILAASDLKEFHNKMVPEITGSDQQEKRGFDRVIRAVINYVRAVPSIDDFESIGHDVFGSEQDPRIKSLREAVQYFRKGTQEGYSKQKPKVAKKGKNIPFEDEQNDATEGQKNNETKNESNKESDLVERIALDLDQLDINETVAKVKEQIDLESITVESNIVEAIASGAEVKPSEGGKYPDKTPAKIVIPQPHFDIKKTAIERHRQGQMSPLICQLLTKGEIKLPVLLEGDVLPPVHKLYQPLRKNVYAILFNLYHARFDRRQQDDKVKGLRRKADELRRKAKLENQDTTVSKYAAEKLREEANQLMETAANTKLAELATYSVREWLPYNNYEAPETVEATELPVPVPTLQRLWFGQAPEDKQKRLQAFLSCLFCDGLNHAAVPPHLVVMCCVLSYMWQQNGDDSILRKPELDAFLATALCPELRDAAYLTEMRLEMVTVRGVHLATMFIQGLEMALLANDVCGSPVPFQMTFPWTFFDGKLFHSKLIRATQARNLVELCDGRVDMAYQIERIRNVIMMSGVPPGSKFPAKFQNHPSGFKFNQQPKSHKLWTPKKKTNPKQKDKTKKNEPESNGEENFTKDAEIVVEKVETLTA